MLSSFIHVAANGKFPSCYVWKIFCCIYIYICVCVCIYTYTPYFLCPFICQMTLGCFCILAIMNNAAMTVGCRCLWEVVISFPSDVCQVTPSFSLSTVKEQALEPRFSWEEACYTLAIPPAKELTINSSLGATAKKFHFAEKHFHSTIS